MNFYTYLHCKPNGEPFYVGKGRGRRAYLLSRGENKHHKNIVEKYGAENIGVFVFPCDSEDQAFQDEILQISQLRRDGYRLVNRSNGGDGTSSFRMSDEHRAKIAASSIGKKMSDQAKEKMSLAKRGKSSWNKGIPMTDEWRAKFIGNKNALGCKRSEETKAKIGATNKLRAIERAEARSLWKNANS